MKDASFNKNQIALEKHLVSSTLGGLKLDEIKPHHVEAWLEQLQVKLMKKIGKQMVTTTRPASPTSKRRYHDFVRAILNMAVRHEVIHKNPCSQVKVPTIPEHVNTQLTPEQFATLYKTRSRSADICIVAAETGLPRGEIVEICWENISDDGLLVTNHKDGDKVDPIPLSALAREAIVRQDERSEWVFSTESGNQLGLRNVDRDVRVRFNSLGFPSTTRLHDLRGKFLSDLINSGVDIKTTQVLARHSDARTTLKHYLRVPIDNKRTP